jgi:hypothetical protein
MESTVMANNKYPLPNMDNITPGGLIDMIAAYREMTKEAKFYEGVYRQRLDATRDPNQISIEGEKFLGNFSTSQSERIDTEAIRQAFSRQELIDRGFLKVMDIVTLRTVPREQPVQNLKA